VSGVLPGPGARRRAAGPWKRSAGRRREGDSLEEEDAVQRRVAVAGAGFVRGLPLAEEAVKVKWARTGERSIPWTGVTSDCTAH
jgi:hypothetical protein